MERDSTRCQELVTNRQHATLWSEALPDLGLHNSPVRSLNPRLLYLPCKGIRAQEGLLASEGGPRNPASPPGGNSPSNADGFSTGQVFRVLGLPLSEHSCE